MENRKGNARPTSRGPPLPMSAAEVERIGIAIYGNADGWPALLAMAMGVDRRVIQRWSRGQMAVAPSAAADLRTLYEIATRGRRIAATRRADAADSA